MEYINIIEASSFLTAGVMLTLVVGYARALLQSKHDVVFHLVASICLVYVAYTLRTGYWDILVMADVVGERHRYMNLVFNGLTIWGGLHGHIAMHRMIPAEERGNWSLWTAWMYPPFMVFGFMRRFARWVQSLR